MRVVLHHQQHRILGLQVFPIVRDLLLPHRQHHRLKYSHRGRSRGRIPGHGPVIGRAQVGKRQIQGEGAAAAGDAAQADLPAQQVRQLAADGQSETRAAVLAGGARIGLLESLEYDPLLLRGYADAGITDRELDHRGSLPQDRMLGTPADGGDTHVQAHAAALGELERVREQILQYLQQALGVGGDRPSQARIEVRREGQLARVRLVAEIALDGLAQVREQQVFTLDRDRARFDLGQVEDVADEVEQVGAGAVDRLGELDLS